MTSVEVEESDTVFAALLPDAVLPESALPIVKKENLCEGASENLCVPEEASVNLEDGACVSAKEGKLRGNVKDGMSENQQDVCVEQPASERGEERTPSHTEDGQPIQETTDTEFAAMEGDLLDFEDFNNESVLGSKNVDEDGAADKKLSEKPAIDKEDGACSEGELNDDGDLEEGELRESLSTSLSDVGQPRQVCRFFHRGVCYYGSACRFLHLGSNNQKGNYSMFENTTRPSGFPNHTQHLGTQRQHPRAPEREREFIEAEPIPPPFSNEESPWEKGLREARNLLKLAQSKRNDPNHNEKKLNLSLCLNEKNIPPPDLIELKNDKRGDNFSSYKGYDSYGDPPHMYNERREKDSRENRQKRMSVERRFSTHTHKGRNPNRAPTHNTDIERPFFENYFDPWRRSKSPNLSRERDRSQSSLSSYSSYSRSSSGSRSPASHTSRSSCRSSRRTSSSRSRSVSRNSSQSRSISMDSISNSTVSDSEGSDSEHEIKDLREKSAVTNPDSTPLDNKFRGIGSILNSKRDELEEKFEDGPVEDLRYLIPKIPEKKEPVRLALTHKNPIKLTLLNKFPQSKAGFSKETKEFAVKKPDEPLKLNLIGVKRPLSPESAEPVKQTPVLLPKKSASSRRDELLKQLKAVEDAIARKRAKF